MKVKVLKKFRDKHTNKIHKVNSVIEVTKERLDEILKVDKLVEEVSEETSTEAAEVPEKEIPTKKAKATKKITE